MLATQGKNTIEIQKNTVCELDEKSVHLWCFSLDDCSCHVSEYERLLSDDERVRAARFRFEKDRTRYCVSHGVLRIILGSYLDREPQSILFSMGEAGKPEIIKDQAGPLITFNISHSGSAVLVGVSKDRRIGVDIELLNSGIDVNGIAERHFTREELATLRAKPEEERFNAFYALWTCKEAYLKAIGCGLSGGLRTFTLSGKDNGWVLSSGTSVGQRRTDHWTIQSLNLLDGYAAALAIEGTGLAVVMAGTVPDRKELMCGIKE